MPAAPLSKLPADRRRELLDDLNYLNLAEIKDFCRRHSIPYTIAIETADGRRKKSGEDDRKGVVLKRVRHFLMTGSIPEETCFRASVVCFDPRPRLLTADYRLFYGQYDQADAGMIALLKKLTGGEFRNGAIARIVAREFWSRGEAPTFREYAEAWMKARRDHTAPNPEWAFLSDRASGRASHDWKALRARKAAAAIRLLETITAR